MGLKKDYENLYQHWLKEFQQANLTLLNQKLFDQYNKLLNTLDIHQENETDNLKIQVFESYRKNLNYIYEDLLKIRELKIINAALTLKDIDTDNVIEAEKLLYQNLISSIKGYRKVKAMAILDGEKELKIEELMETTDGEEPEIVESVISLKENKNSISTLIPKQKPEELDFTLLRFIKKTPPLVGIDLINYGPFEEQDIAYIPSLNAKILIMEKFAEKIEIS